MDPSIIYALMNRDFFIIPEHLLVDISDADLVNDAFWQQPIGSGPCIFESMNLEYSDSSMRTKITIWALRTLIVWYSRKYSPPTCFPA